jgi:RNA polymerase sigma factor (TIGR02999 family)
MMTPPQQEVTQLLLAWRGGDHEALDRLVSLVYTELRSLAHRYIRRENPGQTLQTTALVHEAYLRLAAGGDVDWQNRGHFFAVCAQVMRHLLVDRARARLAAKRGGGAIQLSLDRVVATSLDRDAELLALNAALDKLAMLDERKCRIVELRFFSGLSVEETAGVMGLSAITIKREWQRAKAFLYDEINASSQ